MLHSDVIGEGWSIHEVLILAFLFVTAPISANFLAKVAIHKGTCEVPPKPTTDKTWATLKVPEADGDLSDAKQG
jgi:multicomponent K+:H+ antiporter subunit G